MNRYFPLCFLLLVFFSRPAQAQQNTKQIFIQTDKVTLGFTVGKNQKLYQSYLGEKLANSQDNGLLPATRHEAYVPAGTDNLFEPAIRMVHTDGNPSLELRYDKHTTQQQEENVTATAIHLKDPKYPVEVILHFNAFQKENIIKTWTEIRHKEKKPVVLSNFASAMLHFDAPNYWLSQFHGDWAGEMQQQESQLTSGIKIIDSKLGTRAHKYQSPTFLLALDKPAGENHGELIAGTLAWSGNFQFAFELDEQNSLRILAGMNPYASEYRLEPNKPFVTPAFIFTYSRTGKGQASRSFHRWARNYGILDGNKPRLTLLNNWEATFFDFDEKKLVGLFDGAAQLGVDLFLLDDGWFGNKYPRNDAKAGLGDWQENKTKLPSGIGYLVEEAEKKGVKFGIWLEPEMVNPKSELYEKHPDWILKLPNREEHYQRNQLVLDLINPKVQDFMYNLVDDLLTKNPKVAYIKWDSNRSLTNTYSPYLKTEQSKLYIDYVHSLYKVLGRIRQKYPHLPIMLCSGGGGRVDYGALPFFTEFWPSDNTDGLERVKIQWGYSNFFPAIAMSSHVTSWGKQSVKYRTDVAMMGKLGYDIQVSEFNEKDLQFSKQAVANYKRLSDVIWFGDQYRLVSPYDEDRAVLMYVSENKSKAVLFSYNLQTRHRDRFTQIRLEGLDPQKKYMVQETNLYPETKSSFTANGKTYSGDYLMKVGIAVSPTTALTSAVFEIVEKP
ncbi:alpha-galactosidase [Rufibacter sp. XAAS-G3-1]|uniref:alpha-galactosidase n=1 Tax=Rufibacter sp. XAAS-G3-1 TaxID=2729134 RepID=UPI001C62EEEB|nr:alpha-galactosidase [Rufibacter sp. XAAS-G3-1]